MRERQAMSTICKRFVMRYSGLTQTTHAFRSVKYSRTFYAFSESIDNALGKVRPFRSRKEIGDDDLLKANVLVVRLRFGSALPNFLDLAGSGPFRTEPREYYSKHNPSADSSSRRSRVPVGHAVTYNFLKRVRERRRVGPFS